MSAASWTPDRFGIGWRPELAASILHHRDRIDLIEVIADDYLELPAREVRPLRTLAANMTVLLHGVSLGLASTEPPDRKRLDRMARLLEAVRPAAWSEHLAFVRGGGIEIGHLAAPPRNDSTLSGAAHNLREAAATAGEAPWIENVATLLDPPGSDREEVTWVSQVLEASGCGLLLDLHNLHVNAVNIGFDPRDYIARLPAGCIRAIHLAGGRSVGPVGGRRLLDDHLHDVPDQVYELLEHVGACTDGPLAVILERDGRYPPFDSLLAQLDRARASLAAGRSRSVWRAVSPRESVG